MEDAGISKKGPWKRLKFDVVLVTKLDRMMRSITNMESLVTSLDGQGIGLVAIDQGITTLGEDMTAKLVRRIISAVAEWEREMIVCRVKEGVERAKKHGTRTGRPFSAVRRLRCPRTPLEPYWRARRCAMWPSSTASRRPRSTADPRNPHNSFICPRQSGPVVGEARLSSSPGNEASNNHCITLENPLTYGRIIYFGVFIVALLLMGLFFVSNTSARNGLLLSVGGYALISLSLFLLFGVTVVGIIRAPRQVQIGDDQIVLFFIRGGRKVVPMGSVADLVVPKEDKDSRWGLCGVLGIKGQRQRYSITHEAARTILARYIAIFSRAPPVPDWYHDAYNPDGTEKSLWKKRAAP